MSWAADGFCVKELIFEYLVIYLPEMPVYNQDNNYYEESSANPKAK